MKISQFLLICFTILSFNQDALALSCASYNEKYYDVIFKGQASKTEKGNFISNNAYKTTFEILIPLKGNLDKFHTIYHNAPLPSRHNIWINAKCKNESEDCVISSGECAKSFDIPEFGRSSLHFIACHGDAKKLQDLVNASNVFTRYPQKEYGQSHSYDYLRHVNNIPEDDFITKLPKSETNSNQTLLTTAIICKNESSINYLLNNYPNLINYSSELSPVMMAIKHLTIQNKDALIQIFQAADLIKIQKAPNHDLKVGSSYSEDRGTVCEEVSNKEATPLQFAIACASKEVADLALKQVKISDMKQIREGDLLNFTLRSKNAEVILSHFSMLSSQINKTDKYGYTPLLNAIIASQKVEIIDFLIQSGANVNLVSKLKRNLCPIYMDSCIAAGDINPVHMAVNICHTSALKSLIANGADLNWKSSESCSSSLLNSALQNSNKNCSQTADILFKNNLSLCKEEHAISGIFQYAIKSGVSENLKVALDNVKNPSQDDLDQAIKLAVFQGSHKMVQYLLEKGSNPNALDFIMNRSLLHTGKTYTPLRIYGKDSGNFTETVQELIKFGADLNAQDKNGNTPLHSAVQEGSVEIVKVLLQAGSRKDIRNKAGKTAADMIDVNFRNPSSYRNRIKDKAKLKKLLDS